MIFYFSVVYYVSRQLFSLVCVFTVNNSQSTGFMFVWWATNKRQLYFLFVIELYKKISMYYGDFCFMYCTHVMSTASPKYLHLPSFFLRPLFMLCICDMNKQLSYWNIYCPLNTSISHTTDIRNIHISIHPNFIYHIIS